MHIFHDDERCGCFWYYAAEDRTSLYVARQLGLNNE